MKMPTLLPFVLKISVKAGKDSTGTLNLVINRVRLEKTCKTVH
jgi:hypothetical protein